MHHRQWPLCCLERMQLSNLLELFHRVRQMHAKSSPNVLNIWSSRELPRRVKLHMMCSHAVRHLLSRKIRQGDTLFPGCLAKNLAKTSQNVFSVQGSTRFGFFLATSCRKDRPKKLFELDVCWGPPPFLDSWWSAYAKKGFSAKRFVGPRCSGGARFIKGAILIRGSGKLLFFLRTKDLFFHNPLNHPRRNTTIVLPQQSKIIAKWGHFKMLTANIFIKSIVTIRDQ